MSAVCEAIRWVGGFMFVKLLVCSLLVYNHTCVMPRVDSRLIRTLRFGNTFMVGTLY